MPRFVHMALRVARVVILVFVLASVCVPVRIFADDVNTQFAQKQKEIDELKQKIAQAQGQIQTLSSALTFLSNKKALTQKQIEATQFQILLLQRDIESLDGKIGLLEGSLDRLTQALLHNVGEGYKKRTVNALDLFLSSRKFSDFYADYQYLLAAQRYRQDMLAKTTQAKMDYDKEKTIKEQKQKEITDLKAKFVKQQQDLIEQEKAKQTLLSQTRNDEATYQRLLAQAQTELSSLRGFAISKGGGTVPPQHSPDGWYFSQRDERWAGMCIGNSCGTRSEGTILDVGCLISDVAMIKKKYGEDVTPASIAANSIYFFSTTAYMLQPWPAPGGYQYVRSGLDQGVIDRELREGRPVIVHLRINTRDGHFIVLKSGQNGDYVMHDPWEGYDKKFLDFYRISQITDINYLKKT